VIEFEELTEEEGGGFFACIPDLGRSTCVGDGHTLEEAYESVMAMKEHLIREARQAGEDIPQPSPDMDAYSGTFLVRTTNELHYALANQAAGQGVSLNHLVSSLLTVGVSLRAIIDAAAQEVTAIVPRVTVATPGPTDWDRKCLEEEQPDAKRKSPIRSTGYGEVVQ
jgi:predicted RNase H-like HicB family nuclease